MEQTTAIDDVGGTDSPPARSMSSRPIWANVLVLVLCLGAGAVLLVVGVGFFLDNRALDERGVTVRAELVDVQMISDEGSTNSDLTVRFHPRGSTHRVTTEVEYKGNFYDDYEARPAEFVALHCAASQLPANCIETHVAVEYDPQHAQRARLAGTGADWAKTGVFAGFGAFLLIAGAVEGVSVVRKMRRPRPSSGA
jgi:hypothetical protein